MHGASIRALPKSFLDVANVEETKLRAAASIAASPPREDLSTTRDQQSHIVHTPIWAAQLDSFTRYDTSGGGTVGEAHSTEHWPMNMKLSEMTAADRVAFVESENVRLRDENSRLHSELSEVREASAREIAALKQDLAMLRTPKVRKQMDEEARQAEQVAQVAETLRVRYQTGDARRNNHRLARLL